MKHGKLLKVGDRKSANNSYSDKTTENSFLDSDVTHPNGTSTNQDANVTNGIDFTIDNNNQSEYSKIT